MPRLCTSLSSEQRASLAVRAHAAVRSAVEEAFGEGLSDDVQTLSVVVEPATLSISDELHAVQLIQETWLDVVEYCPLKHATHTRSELLVPLVEIYLPIEQSDHG